jgi:hypothetical protein
MSAAKADLTGAKYAVGLAGNDGVAPRSVSPAADKVKLGSGAWVVVVVAGTVVVVVLVVVVDVGRVAT